MRTRSKRLRRGCRRASMRGVSEILCVSLFGSLCDNKSVFELYRKLRLSGEPGNQWILPFHRGALQHQPDELRCCLVAREMAAPADCFSHLAV